MNAASIPAASKNFPVSWDELHRHSRALAWRLLELGPWRGIIAVTRGGLVPAAIVARELDIRLVDTVCIASYDGKVQRREAAFLKRVEGDGGGWLVIDDLVDSGNTFRSLRQILPHAHYASVYVKPAGADSVDSAAIAIDQDLWLAFPWDEDPPVGE